MTPTLGSGGSDGSLGQLDHEVLAVLGRGCVSAPPSRLRTDDGIKARIQIPTHTTNNNQPRTTP